MTSHTDAYMIVLRHLDTDLDQEHGAIPKLAATTLTRYWQLLHPSTWIGGGRIHVPEIRFNNRTFPARSNPLPGFIQRQVGDDPATVLELLGISDRRLGHVIERHRVALSEVELPTKLTLEQLPVLHLAALLETAPTPDHRHAVLAAAGLPAKTPTAQRRRRNLPPDTLAWFAYETDRLLTIATNRTTTAPDTKRAVSR